MKSLKLETYLQALEKREKSKATTRTAELLDPYLRYFNWQDDTFFQDMMLLQMKSAEYMKRSTDHEFKKLLEWAKEKDLHPKQFVKLLNK